MTEEEKLELEALRLEKHQRTQQQRAQAALEATGVPASFAPLLIGLDDADTDAKVGQFCTAYQESLTAAIQTRLPQQAPITTPPVLQRSRRGIQRIH